MFLSSLYTTLFFFSFFFSCFPMVPDLFYHNCLYRASAEEAIQKMQGKMIGQLIVRISWGRSPTAKQVIAFSSSHQMLTLIQ